MEEVEIRFEPSERSGVVAVGSYLADVARRLGVEIVDEFAGEGEYEADTVRVTRGAEFLSEPTKIEIEHLSIEGRARGERLASQVRIEKAGEIVVAVPPKQETEVEQEEAKTRDFKKEFAELPLEKKVANLLEMEAVTLNETFSLVVNSPFKIFEKVMDVLAEFGLKLDQEAKRAKRPGEHQNAETEAAAAAETASTNGRKAGKSAAKTKAAAKKAAPAETTAAAETVEPTNE